MKIIFLDIDGVLNKIGSPTVGGIYDIDLIFLPILKKIIESTNSEIVLSSTWRKTDKNKKRVEEVLGQFGLKIKDCTEIFLKNKKFSQRVERKEEIQEWLDRHPAVKKFAIIDDDPDACIDGHFFQTTCQTGLTVEISEKIISHFND
jgi:hypothetical protein